MEKAFIKELGLKGLIIMLCRLLLRPDIRKAMKEYWNIFKKYKDYIGYAYIIGRKPVLD